LDLAGLAFVIFTSAWVQRYGYWPGFNHPPCIAVHPRRLIGDIR